MPKFLNNIDLNKNELQNARIQNLATAPANPAVGQIYFDTAETLFLIWDGSAWIDFLARDNHTGTQTASTISDFEDTVQESQLDELAVPTSSVDMNDQKITSLGTPTETDDAATKGYVDSVAQGLSVRASVKGASTGNLTLANEQTVDGVSLVAGDRILVKDQTSEDENGVYIVVDSGDWTRSTDMDAWAELISAFVFVQEGTANVDTGWVCTVDAGGTLDTTDVTWTQFTSAGEATGANTGTDGVGVYDAKSGTELQFRNIAPASARVTVTLDADDNDIDIDVDESELDINAVGGGPLAVAGGGTGATTAAGARTELGATTKVTATIGDGSNTSLAVTHSLGVKTVIAQVYRTASPYDVIMCDIEQTDVNTTTFKFAVAPGTNEYTAVIIG